jgi:hypothetical protein
LQSRSIELQERTLRQWVEIGNWRMGFEIAGQDSFRQPNAISSLVISADIVNPTTCLPAWS